MKPDLFEAALLKTQKTWQTYVKALCALDLVLLIDRLGGSNFLNPGGQIDVAGFKVVREALSATYGILFAVFIVATFCESRLLKKFSETAVHFPESAEVALWFLSPFSWSRWGRGFRIVLFINGYFWLAWFARIHITNKYPPLKDGMKHPLYVGIGYVDAIIFLVCVCLGVMIYLDIRCVRHRLKLIGERAPDTETNR